MVELVFIKNTNVNYLEVLIIATIFFVFSFYFAFYNKKSVDSLAESKKNHLRSQNYSEEQINKLINPNDWYLFYKLSGYFGLVVTSIGIIISLKHLLF